MKNLANCKPSEFLAQTFKIKKSVQDWLDVTQIMDIRKTKPQDLIKLDGLSGDERENAVAENRKKIQAQARKNFADMLDKMLNDNAEKTAMPAMFFVVKTLFIKNTPKNSFGVINAQKETFCK